MKYLDYREQIQQGTFDFPIAYHYVSPTHPRYEMTTHWHPECEIIRILSGSFTLSLDGQSHECNPGDVIFVNDGQLHGGTPHNCIYECFLFDMKYLLKNNHVLAHRINNFTSHTDVIRSYLSEEDDGLHEVLSDLSTSMSNKDSGYEFSVLGALYSFIGIIIRRSLYTHELVPLVGNTHSLQHLKDVLDHIEYHYNEDITLQDLADIANMNHKYFCRFFKEMTQRTPIDYLNYYRIECACNMLLNSDKSIADIAVACGFSDTSYFIRTFKKYKATTPKQYTKQHGGKSQ